MVVWIWLLDDRFSNGVFFIVIVGIWIILMRKADINMAVVRNEFWHVLYSVLIVRCTFKPESWWLSEKKYLHILIVTIFWQLHKYMYNDFWCVCVQWLYKYLLSYQIALEISIWKKYIVFNHLWFYLLFNTLLITCTCDHGIMFILGCLIFNDFLHTTNKKLWKDLEWFVNNLHVFVLMIFIRFWSKLNCLQVYIHRRQKVQPWWNYL